MEPDAIIGRCPNNDPLTEEQVASGECPTCGTNLFPGKTPAAEKESPPPGDWDGTED